MPFVFETCAECGDDREGRHELIPAALGGTAPGEPAWTPDGQRLAFDDGGIYSVRVDGGDRRLLVANGAWPAFSPDGSKLAYVARSGGNYGIDIADADGSSPRAVALSVGPGSEWNTAWSPNGTLLAFSRAGTDPRDVAIVVADPDGSSEHVIPSAANSDPLWSPDSKLIAFVGNQNVVVARADGGGERVVLRSAEGIAWRPASPLPPEKRLSC